MNPIDPSDFMMVRGRLWYRAEYEQHRRGLTALRDAEVAIRRSDVRAFVDSMVILDRTPDGWRRLLRRIARIDACPSPEFQRAFLRAMSTHGDHIRGEVNDDLAIVDALRAVFTPYRGRGLCLYRGDSAENRRRRTYGYSWSLSRTVAKDFAQWTVQHSVGGSVLLETDAPPNAVIRIIRGGMHPDEREVWIDRRQLGQVRVLERYPQVPFDCL